MFSHVGDGLWFAIKIILCSTLFILIFSHIGNPPPQVATRVRPPAYLAEYRAARALREEKRRVRQIIQPFPFGNLPTELRFAVLSYAVGTDNRMLVSLSLVCKEIRYDAFRECLLRVAVTLTTRRQLVSFDRFCLDNPELARFVQHLWIAPSEEEDRFPSLRVIERCVNIKSLACDIGLLDYGLGSGGEIEHRNCRNLTLLRRQGIRGRPPPVQPRAPIFGQLTHMRVVGNITLPKSCIYSNLTHFSYVCARGKEAQCAKTLEKIIRRKEERYPQLSMMVVTQQGQGDARAELVRQDQNFRVLVYYTPDEEVDIWRDGVLGKSVWDKADELFARAAGVN